MTERLSLQEVYMFDDTFARMSQFCLMNAALSSDSTESSVASVIDNLVVLLFSLKHSIDK